MDYASEAARMNISQTGAWKDTVDQRLTSIGVNYMGGITDLDQIVGILQTVPTTNGNNNNNEAIASQPSPISNKPDTVTPRAKSITAKEEGTKATQTTTRHFDYYDEAMPNSNTNDRLISSRALDILGKTSAIVGGVASIAALGLLAVSSVAWIPTLGVIAFGATLGGMVISSLKYHYDDINGKKYAEEMMIASPGLVLGGVGLLGRAVSVVSNSIKGIITYSASALSGTTAPASMLYGLLE